MIARIRKSMEEKDQGFTLVELLVVMIIIGILAAIAIPVFLNQRAKARDTAARADVSTLGKELAAFYVDGTGTAPGITQNATTEHYNYASGVTGVDADLGPYSSNVNAVSTSGTDDTDWCVEIGYTGGTADTITYSAAGGLGDLGSTCP